MDKGLIKRLYKWYPMSFVRNTLQYLLGEREGFLDEVLILQHLEKISITCTRAVFVRWHILSFQSFDKYAIQ
jgi:hypothetical protein